MNPELPPRIPKRRRRLLTWRRFVYLVGWSMIVSGLYGVVGLVAWHSLRDHGDRMATVAWGEGTVSYERLEVTAGGNVEIDGLQVTRAGEPLFSAERVRVKLDLEDVAQPSVESVDVYRPKVFLTGKRPGAGNAEAPPTSPEAWLPEWLRVGRVTLREGELKVAVPGLPSLSLEYDVEIAGLDPSSPDALSPEPMRVTLRDVRMNDVKTGSRAVLGKAVASFRIAPDLVSGVVESLRLEGLDATVTEEMWQKVFGAVSPADAPPASGRWEIRAVEIVDARVAIDGFSDREVLIPDFHAGFDAELRGLVIGGEGISAEAQTLRLRDVLLDASLEGLPSGEMPPLLACPEAVVRLIPDVFLRDHLIDALSLRDPAVSVDKARVARLTALLYPADAAPPAEKSAATDPPALPAIFKVRDLSIEGGRIDAEAGQMMAGLPAASARFRVETLGKPEDASALYALELADLRIEENGQAERPFGRGNRALVRFTPEGVQRGNRIEAIEIEGLDLTIGDDVLRLADAFGGAPEGSVVPPPVPEKAEPAPEVIPWRAGRVEIRDSRITLVDMVPGLPFVPIQLETTLDDVPLTDQEHEEETMQRMELSGLEVTSPYDSLTAVANLRTIFVEFTFAGLLRHEVEQIEIVSPEIFVGEPLFWYIDYFRGDVGGEGDAPPAEAPPADAVATDAPAIGGQGTIAALEDAFSNATISGWKIKRFQAHSGKIIIAPKGQPLGIFPFPFSFETDVEKRLLSVQLTVESGDYVFEKLEAELLGLKGESFFNYPIREKDNNFVQTFTALGLHFKEYEAQKISLTVTYDRAGIYGKLWSAAYGGDLNAEFNIYIGDTYKWDAWASAADFDLGPFTDAVAPDSFRMKGILGGKFVANGEEFRIDRAYGDATLGEGTMHITKLDDFVASLPEGWSALQKAITTAGIDVFRNYDFTEGRAALDLTGRDGTASLFLGGPDGVRDLAFRFFDERAVAAASALEKKESPVPGDAP